MAMSTQPQVSLVPPFTRETAAQKARKAEDGWNSRDPQRVSLAYTVDCKWRNRSEFINGREEIIQFLTRKWNRELDYRLIKELWAFDDARIAVRFAYEFHDDTGQWYRAYGNENWESTGQASCTTATHPSTTCPFAPSSVCSTGLSGHALRITRGLAIWVCRVSARSSYVLTGCRNLNPPPAAPLRSKDAQSAAILRGRSSRLAKSIPRSRFRRDRRLPYLQ